MNYKIRLTVFFVLSLYMVSCTFKGNLKGLYSYYDETKKENPNLLVTPDSNINICDLVKKDSAKVYVINGKRLRNCLSDEKLTLVYIWGPKCTSSVCIPLNIIQEECNRNNIELHIVAEYYDNRLMQINYDIKRPILGIDIDYYKRNLTSKYLSRFLNELSNTVADNSDNRYILYKNGNFSASFHSIENLIESITNKTSRRNINFEKQ